MLLNIITGFSNSKTAIWLTEESPLKEKLTRMKTTSIISEKENSGTSGNICKVNVGVWDLDINFDVLYIQ